MYIIVTISTKQRLGMWGKWMIQEPPRRPFSANVVPGSCPKDKMEWCCQERPQCMDTLVEQKYQLWNLTSDDLWGWTWSQNWTTLTISQVLSTAAKRYTAFFLTPCILMGQFIFSLASSLPPSPSSWAGLISVSKLHAQMLLICSSSSSSHLWK